MVHSDAGSFHSIRQVHHQCLSRYGSIKADHQCLSRIKQHHGPSTKLRVNMAEEPSTAAILSHRFVLKSSVCGHHVYKRVWSPCVGESLETFCEEDNEHDKYAVAVHLSNC